MTKSTTLLLALTAALTLGAAALAEPLTDPLGTTDYYRQLAGQQLGAKGKSIPGHREPAGTTDYYRQLAAETPVAPGVYIVGHREPAGTTDYYRQLAGEARVAQAARTLTINIR